MADILEVIRAIGEFEGLSEDDLADLRDRKAEKRGGFSDRIVLERVEP